MKLIAIWLGKIALLLTRILHFGSGTTFPGLLAEKIDQNIIRKLSAKLSGGAIIVTGTNGKTSTSKMLVEILSEEGFTVLHNPSGSNLTRGIASALIQSVNIFGTKLEADIAVFEIDEATMPEATTKIRPKVVLVTNLFRDQLDRYGELDKTAEIIASSLRGFFDLTVILNGDDPLVSGLAGSVDGSARYFGLNESKISTNSKAAMDSKDCINCGHELEYKNRYFGHLGVWACPKCGLARPKIDYEATNILLTPKSVKFDANFPDEKLPIEMSIPGLYNVYNALSAAAAAEVVGAKGPAISHAIKNFAAAFGRMEIVNYNDRKAMLLLVKNPTGANQSLAAVLSDDGPKKILFALNDNFADGTDVSWIWDIDFEALKLAGIEWVASGIRAQDIALRLKYAGVETKNITIEPDSVRAFEKTAGLVKAGEMFFVLPTYTALMEIRGKFATRDDRLAELGKVTKHGI